MVCPCRTAIRFEVASVGGKAVVKSQEQYFPECYEEECPYYDYPDTCKAIDDELGE